MWFSGCYFLFYAIVVKYQVQNVSNNSTSCIILGWSGNLIVFSQKFTCWRSRQSTSLVALQCVGKLPFMVFWTDANEIPNVAEVLHMTILLFLVRSVDRASWIMCMITNLIHCLSSVYSIITPLHVSGISAAHHQEVECVDVANGTAKLTVSQPRSITSTICHIIRYILSPDDGLLICPKDVEVC
jgi:hypothetical protein